MSRHHQVWHVGVFRLESLLGWMLDYLFFFFLLDNIRILLLLQGMDGWIGRFGSCRVRFTWWVTIAIAMACHAREDCPSILWCGISRRMEMLAGASRCSGWMLWCGVDRGATKHPSHPSHRSTLGLSFFSPFVHPPIISGLEAQVECMDPSVWVSSPPLLQPIVDGGRMTMDGRLRSFRFVPRQRCKKHPIYCSIRTRVIVIVIVIVIQHTQTHTRRHRGTETETNRGGRGSNAHLHPIKTRGRVQMHTYQRSATQETVPWTHVWCQRKTKDHET